MLVKLLKYEMRATYRSFIPVYMVILILSLINSIFISFDFTNGISGVSMVLAGLYIALAVTTVVFIIKRFSQNLFCDEGYLMNTLPVTSKSLILSKLISTLIWIFLSFLTATLSGFILLSNSYTRIHLTQFWDKLKTDIPFFISTLKEQGVSGIFIFVFLLAIVGIVSSILQAYFCMSMTQIYPFSQKRVPSAVIMYVSINLLVSVIGDAFKKLFIALNDKFNNINLLITYVALLLLINIVICAGYFLASCYILDKRLNLE